MLKSLRKNEVKEVFGIDLNQPLQLLHEIPANAKLPLKSTVVYGRVTAWDWDNYLITLEPVNTHDPRRSVIVHVKTSEFAIDQFYYGMQVIAIGRLNTQARDGKEWLRRPMLAMRGMTDQKEDLQNLYVLDYGMIHPKNFAESLHLNILL